MITEIQPQNRFVMPLVLRLSENLVGRDFVIGDLHGAVALLEKALDEVDFDEQVDRLFLCGDLIDRGKESHRCAEILKKPYAFAVRGNHEDMLLELYQDGEPPEYVLNSMGKKNGFGWWSTTSDEVRYEIVEAIRKMPLVIEISTQRGCIGIVHAEVPRGMHWNTFLQNIESRDPSTIQSCLWGRERFEAANGIMANDHDGVDGVGRLFVGHNMHFDGLKRYGNVYALDTAAVHGQLKNVPGARLTMVNTLMCTSILTAPKSPSLIDVRDDPIRLQRGFSR